MNHGGSLGVDPNHTNADLDFFKEVRTGGVPMFVSLWCMEIE